MANTTTYMAFTTPGSFLKGWKMLCKTGSRTSKPWVSEVEARLWAQGHVWVDGNWNEQSQNTIKFSHGSCTQDWRIWLCELSDRDKNEPLPQMMPGAWPEI